MNVGQFFIAGLTILFIGLKLTNHINWSWFQVLIPLIIGLISSLIQLIFEIIDRAKERREQEKVKDHSPFMKRLQETIEANKRRQR
jgi:hypothetical protein